jgi:UDP-glucose 4-epimerase
MLNQMRYGRGLDNRKLKAAGFRYRYTTREAVLALAEHLRLRPVTRNAREPYRYEREVEEFLRWSPSVRRGADDAGTAPERQVSGRGYDALRPAELVALLPSLPAADLHALREHEAQGARRAEVLEEIDRLLSNQQAQTRAT